MASSMTGAANWRGTSASGMCRVASTTRDRAAKQHHGKAFRAAQFGQQFRVAGHVDAGAVEPFLADGRGNHAVQVAAQARLHGRFDPGRGGGGGGGNRTAGRPAQAGGGGVPPPPGAGSARRDRYGGWHGLVQLAGLGGHDFRVTDQTKRVPPGRAGDAPRAGRLGSQMPLTSPRVMPMRAAIRKS